MKCFCCYSHSFIIAVAFLHLISISNSFFLPASIFRTSIRCAANNSNNAGEQSKGFGKNRRNSIKLESLEKTYGEDQTMKYKDIIIDNEAAMSDFFATNAEWHPLFRTIMRETADAWDFLKETPPVLTYHDSSTPWKKLEPIPTQQEKLEVVANWLDSVQKSLVDIPVNEANSEKDELDMHFINEGKRMLAITRFHVVLQPAISEKDLLKRDELFMTCWSELAALRQADEPDTGSIILLPGYDIVDLRRFTDMNLRRPLDWLGVSDSFEVSSFSRGVSAIRILHKLSDIPTDEELQAREEEQ